MRDIPAELISEFTSGRVYPVLLAELYFDSGMIGMWTGYGTIEYEGKQYLGGGNFIGISPIKETQETSAEGIVCSLNGIPSSLISASLERVRGRKFRLYVATATTNAGIALEDDSGAVLMEDGSKILLENQFASTPYRIFSGLMDVTEFVDNGQSATVRLSVENALIRGQSAKTMRYTPEEQKRTYPADKGLDLINQLQDKEVVW